MKNTAHPVDRTANWCSHGGWFTLAASLAASFGLFACLDFGPGPLFPFLSLSWVLSFYEVWQVSSTRL
jgi:hypothetical protein